MTYQYDSLKRLISAQTADSSWGNAYTYANGGEFAPGIVTRIAPRTDAEIASVIRNGLPSRGMPEIQLGDQALADLIAHLRTRRPPRRGVMAAIRHFL